MDLTAARHFQPLARQGAVLELDVDFGARLGKREEARAEAQHQIVAFKESTTEVGKHHFQVFKADVFTHPQAFALVEHGRVGSVAVYTVGTAWGNHADFRHTLASI